VRRAGHAGPVAFALALLAAACTGNRPVELGTAFTPRGNTWLSSAHGRGAAAACPVRLAAVRNSLADPHVLGSIGARPIHAADLDGWVRSGFYAVRGDARLTIVDADPPGTMPVAVSIDVLKAYTLSLTTEKSTNLVVKARFSGRGGAEAEVTYRGVDTAVNWDSGQGETQSSFDRALAHVLDQLDQDIVMRCTTGGED